MAPPLHPATDGDWHGDRGDGEEGREGDDDLGREQLATPQTFCRTGSEKCSTEGTCMLA